MRNIFLIIIFLHASIHLLGFLKAFEITYLPQFSGDISKLSGMFCLLVTVLFFISGIGFIKKENWWSWLAIVSALVSFMLIIAVWKDAKFGIIANFIILTAAFVSIMSVAFNKKTEAEVAQILEQNGTIKDTKVSETEILELPEPVQKWLKVSGVVGKEKIQSVWLKQKARMKMKPEQMNWSEAVAEQYFTIREPAFVWKVKMKMLGLISIAGRDKFVNGKGEMMIKLFSLFNLVNEKGLKMDEGTMQRFLGEIVWFPSAALSPYIHWEPIDNYSAKATMDYGGTTGSGTFTFNENGHFIQYSALRFKDNTTDSKRYEWVINANERKEFNGITIPTKMDATWVLDEGNWKWLEIEILDIKYNLGIE
jgi:hypothetical protein